MSKKSCAWNYFDRKGKDEAECFKCKKILKCGGGSTTGLLVHLKNVHKITNFDLKNGNEVKRPKTLTSFLTSKSIEEEIAKLITSSKFIQESFAKNKYDKPPPTTRQSVSKMVPMYEAQDVAESSMDSETLQLSASLAQIPALETSLSVPSEQSVKKLKKRSCEKSRFEDTLKILQDSFQRDEFSIFGEHVANELRKLQPAAYSMVEHLINNILYEASMGKYDNPTWPPVASQSQDNPDIDNTDGFGNRQKNFDEYSGAVSPASSHTSSTANPVWPISVISGSHQASSPVAVMQESLTDEVTKKKRTGLEDNIKDPGKVDRPGDDGGTKELRKSRSGSTDVLTTRSSHENIPPATDTLHDDRAIDNDTDGKKGGRDKDNQEKSKPPDDLQPPLKKLKRKYSMETIDIFDKENVPVFKTRSDPINDAEYHFLLSLLPELRKIPEDRKLTARIRIQQVLSEEQELKAI